MLATDGNVICSRVIAVGYRNIKLVIPLLKSGYFGLYDAFTKLIDGLLTEMKAE